MCLITRRLSKISLLFPFRHKTKLSVTCEQSVVCVVLFRFTSFIFIRLSTEEGNTVPETQGILGTGILCRLRPTVDLHPGPTVPVAYASRAQHPHLQAPEGIQVRAPSV